MNELFSAITAGLGGMFGWAFTDFFSAKALKKTRLSEADASFKLYAITSIFLWVLVILTGQSSSPLSGPILGQLIGFAVINVAAYLLFFHALEQGSLSTISTLFGTYAVGATVLSILFFGEQTSILRLVSLGIVFLGITGVSIQDTSKLKIIKGLKPVLVAAGLLAIFFPLWDQFLGQQVGSLFWVAVVDTLMAILFFAFMLLKEKRVPVLKKGTGFLILGAVANFIAVVATTWGFEATSLTSVVVVVSSAVPLVSAVLGYTVFKERLILTQYLGIAAIVIGTTMLFGT